MIHLIFKLFRTISERFVSTQWHQHGDAMRRRLPNGSIVTRPLTLTEQREQQEAIDRMDRNAW